MWRCVAVLELSLTWSTFNILNYWALKSPSLSTTSFHVPNNTDRLQQTIVVTNTVSSVDSMISAVMPCDVDFWRLRVVVQFAYNADVTVVKPNTVRSVAQEPRSVCKVNFHTTMMPLLLRTTTGRTGDGAVFTRKQKIDGNKMVSSPSSTNYKLKQMRSMTTIEHHVSRDNTD